jgi:hypothetical protein
MDELEWLRANSPSTEPSRDITRRHRTQLRAAIATEGADGTRPRRPRPRRRSRHRVLVTGAVVVGLCAVGAGVVALSSSGGDGGGSNEVGVPVAGSATTSTAAPATCTGVLPAELNVPAGFGAAVAGPATQAANAPTKGQQVTSWSSDSATIEQRWPADQEAAAQFGSPAAPADGIGSYADQFAKSDKHGYHRTIVFLFSGQPAGCAALQVTVYGRDAAAVDAVANRFVQASPFVSREPLVSTTGAAASAPDVAACEGPVDVQVAKLTTPVVARVGDTVSAGVFAQPTEALTDFLAGHTVLAQRSYQELRLDDGSLVYTKDVVGNVVTTVHVVSAGAGWTVADWRASGC